jgi:hypothetical protein
MSTDPLKHVVVVHNKIEHKKYLLRTVVLIKVLVVTRATGCITQQLRQKHRLPSKFEQSNTETQVTFQI